MLTDSCGLPTPACGQVGVYRVISELLVRGHAPFLPVVDVGVDLLLATGTRLQVKTTQRPCQRGRLAGMWMFTLTKTRRIAGGEIVPGAARVFGGEVDFVVLHAVHGHRFWIVPAHVLDHRKTLLFSENKQWKDIDVDAVRHRLAAREMIEDIAAELKVSIRTLRRRLEGTLAETKRNYADILQYENRWDLLVPAPTGVESTP